MKRRDIEKQLEAMAQVDGAPDPAFVERLAARVEDIPIREVTPIAARRRIPVPRLSWAIAAIVALVVSVSGAQEIGLNLAGHLQPFGQPKTVQTSSTTTPTSHDNAPNAAKSLAGGASVTTTSSTSTSTTTTSLAATAGTEHSHSTTTSTVRAEPTTTTSTIVHTEPSTTTTSTTVVTQAMSLSCTSETAGNTVSVTSKWSAITSSNFADYQLIRWSGTGGASTIVFTTTDQGRTSYVDTGLTPGGNYTYAVVAYAKNGSILGYSKHTPAA